MDRVQSAIAELGDVYVPGGDAERAAKLARTAENALWRWRRSVEAAYLDRSEHPATVVGRIALQEDAPPLVVLTEALKAGALVPDYYRLDKWANEHGVAVWPELQDDATEGSDDE